MDKKLLTAKGRLRWFLDLINADINSLIDRELFSLWTDMREIAYGDWGEAIITTHEIIKWKETRNRTKEIQNLLKTSLEKSLDILSKPLKKVVPDFGPFDVEEEKKITGIGAVLRVAFSYFNQNKPIPKWIREHIPIDFSLNMKAFIDDDDKLFVASDIKSKLLLEFILVLSQFPLSLIKTCQREDCKVFFLKATKKKKRYCSNKCAWVMASRERRKVQPEKEREKKRESYYKKVRKQHPKAMIRKRTRREG